jgi:hypothetical protein
LCSAAAIRPCTDELWEEALEDAPMLRQREEKKIAVRFSTEKNVGFPGLMIIFGDVVTSESFAPDSRGEGSPRIQIELSPC